MRLRGDEGYFAEKVTIPDPEGGEQTFCIREFDDGELKTYDERTVVLGKLEDEISAILNKRLTDLKPVKIGDQMIPMPQPLTEDAAKRLQEAANERLTKLKSLNTWACQRCLVDWSLTHTVGGEEQKREVTSENIAGLPDAVQETLRRRIAQISTLTEDEAGFLPPSPNG